MKEIVNDLNETVNKFASRLSEIPEQEFSAKPNPTKWSRKEVMGHLIDSGQSNLRRFVCGQYDKSPSKIVYDQDFWVKANNYQHMDRNEVITLWKLVNKQIANVLSTMPKENYAKQCDTSKTEVNYRTLEWLAADYVKHMKHHLNQVIPSSFDVTYP